MNAPFELNIHQKRQATLLYHYTSMEYLLGLKARIDALIAGTDITLDTAQAQGRDALIANPRWGVRDTAANWSSFAYPALKDFQQSTAWHIASRVNEVYGKTGAYQCSRMLQEHSMLWATEEEEGQFEAIWNAVYSYASKIDGSTKRQAGWDDFSFALEWREVGLHFQRLPEFRICFDVEVETGKVPPRTGVYVPQDDPYGALQFGWSGDSQGALGKAEILNSFGLHAMQSVGRKDIWINQEKMAAFANLPESRKILKEDDLVEFPVIPQLAPSAVARSAFTSRPCKWYFVELLPNQWEINTSEENKAPSSGNLPDERQRRLPGQEVSTTGYWYTPALPGDEGKRFFRQGERFPDTARTAYGEVIWYFDPAQQR